MFSYTWKGRLRLRVRGKRKYWKSQTCGTLNGFSSCSTSNNVREFHFALSDLIYRTRLMNCWINSFHFGPIGNYRYRSLITSMRQRFRVNPHERRQAAVTTAANRMKQKLGFTQAVKCSHIWTGSDEVELRGWLQCLQVNKRKTSKQIM